MQKPEARTARHIKVVDIIKDSPLVPPVQTSIKQRGKAFPLEVPRFLSPIATPCHGVLSRVDCLELDRLADDLLVSVKAGCDKEVIDLTDRDLSAVG